MIFSFKQWLIEASGLAQNFTHLSQSDRMAQGRDIGEPFIKNQLALNGINITNVPAHMDIHQKVDGMLNGEPVQIKLRRSAFKGRNDISYEVCRNHNPNINLSDQLRDIHQQGRDYKGKVKHYFVMNQQETEIYHIPADAIKNAVDKAIKELDFRGGKLKQPFMATNLVELRPTQDQDPNSFTPNKVMAFIPVNSVADQTYKVQLGVKAPTIKFPVPPPKGISPEFVGYADVAEKNGIKTFPINSTNTKRAQEKIEALRKYANIRKLKFNLNPDGTVSFSKSA